MSIYGRARVKVPASTANLGPGFDTLDMPGLRWRKQRRLFFICMVTR